LESNKEYSGNVAAIAAMMETAFGDFIVSSLIGMIMTYYPSENETIEKLAKEFRVNGLYVAGNSVVEILVPVVMDVFSKEEFKETTIKTRIEEVDDFVEEQDEELVEFELTQKKERA